MTHPRRSTGGQGTLEYVIIFALIAVVLLVVGFLLRHQIQNLGRGVAARFDSYSKEPPPTEGDGKDAAPLPPEENPYLKKKKEEGPAGGKVGGEAKDDKDKKGGVDKPVEVVHQPEPEDPKFSLANLPIGKRVLLIGGGIGVAFALFFFFNAGRKTS